MLKIIGIAAVIILILFLAVVGIFASLADDQYED